MTEEVDPNSIVQISLQTYFLRLLSVDINSK